MGPFYVSAITNATLNITLNTYSLQDALSPNSWHSTQDVDGYVLPYLFETGCWVDGVQNCTAACQKPATAFSTLDTLHNCMMYPVIADQYFEDNLSTEITNLAQSLGIEKAQWPSSNVTRNITGTIRSCLEAYCGTLPYCTEALHQYNQSFYSEDYESSFLNQTGTFYYDLNYQEINFFDLCEYLPVSVNQDIGGIGVYISYWIQTGIGLLAFLMIIWWKWAAHFLSLGVSALSRNSSREARAQKTLFKDRTVRLAALTSGLVDFHKAQCFFVLAINIAAQVDRAKGGLDPQSLQQLYNTWVLIKSISIGGYLPVTFTLFTLHLVDVVSWYLLSLTICTASVSIATLVTIGNFNPSNADISSVSQASTVNGTTACGGLSPGAWCYTPNSMTYDSDPSSGANSMLGFCVFVLSLLIAKQFEVDKHLSDVYRRKSSEYFPKDKYTKRWYSTWRKGMIAAREALRPLQQKILGHRNIKHLRRSSSHYLKSWKPRWTQSKWFTKVTDTTKEAIIKNFKSFRSTDWLKASKKAFIILFYTTVIVLYLCFFNIYCQDLAWFALNGVSSSWSFGQIVAITVWAGPLCEYIHLEIRGMRRGFNHRLLAPYVVVKGDTDAKDSMSDKKGIDKLRAGEGEELATLPTTQPYPSSATNTAYEQVLDLDPPEPKRLSESSESTNSRSERVERYEDFTPLEVNLPEEDITWQMSDFSASEREPLSYA